MDASLAELIDQVHAAGAAKMPLRIRGGASKDFYGHVAHSQASVLDTRGHSGIVSYEPSELVVTVRCGTPLAQLESVLAQHGQCLPFEPPHYCMNSLVCHATVGGMVASGLAGPARACVGGVRDYVLGAHLVNGRGQLLEFGGQVMKNVAGYDLSRVLAGSMGTLGLIAQVSLKVLPIAPAEATLRFAMDEAKAIRSCNEWAGQPLPLNASSWVMDEGKPVLYLRLRGALSAVQWACTRLLQEAAGERVDSPATRADWTAARDLRLPWFQAGFARGDDLWRISVPQTTPPLDLGETMIDWLGGQRWLFAASAERQHEARRIRQAAQAAGGSATLFVASAQSLVEVERFDTLAPVLRAIGCRLKAEFDPLGIFNPTRLGMS